jgi:ribulose-5-phosphate 4-epimerase/fuculose-1-phosphate aldolase
VLQIPSMKSRCSPQEWQARVDLAACYRLVDLYGMSDMMANHISSHVPGEPGAFLINAYGMMYEEITASSLIKVNLAGDVLAKPDFGASALGRSQTDAPPRRADDPLGRPGGQQVIDYGVNRAGYVIHSAIHGARPEVACVIHTHAFASMAVSALQCGLLPITQTAMRFLKIGYHDYQGVVLDDAEKASLLADLGQREALILRNHGALVVGRTVGEAFNWAHRLELACRTQLAAMAAQTPLVPVRPDVLEATWNNYQRGTRRPYGLMEWPALLRKLDRLDGSYRD